MKGGTNTMGAKLKAALTAILAAAFLAACTTTPEEQAGAGVGPPTPAAGGTAPPPVPSKPTARVDVTGKPAGSPFAALKDPNNILSKRSIYYDYDKFDVKDEYRSPLEAHA